MKKLIPSAIALVHWGLIYILQIDKLYFRYEQENWLTYIIKGFTLIVLLIFYNFLFWIVKRSKLEGGRYTRGIKIFAANFCLQMVILFFLWPGTWSLDDVNVLGSIQVYRIRAWQHVLTNFYQMVLLQILPFPAGIIILQCVIISICVAFCIIKLEKQMQLPVLKHAVADMILKLCPFFLPPVIMYQMSGYRMGLYIFLEYVLLVILLCAAMEKQKWSWNYTLFVGVLSAIVCTWRTEGIIFVPFVVLILCISNKKVGKRQVCLATFIMIFGVLGITKIQNSFLPGTGYELITTARPCTALVRATHEDEDKTQLDVIDKVINVDVILENPTMNGEELYWNCGLVQNGYSKEDYHKYLDALIRLGLKYPKVLIGERLSVFAESIGLGEQSTAAIIPLSSELLDYPYTNGYAEKFAGFEAIFSDSWNTDVRKSVIHILGMQKQDGQSGMLYRIFWSSVVPILAILVALIYEIKKKNLSKSLLLFAVFLQLAAVFIAEPGGWPMYVLSTYMIGYVIIIYELLIHWKGKN